MRKAVTPIISVILLVLITVGASVVAFSWISSVSGRVEESAGGSITQGPAGSSTRLQLISVRGDGVTVQNLGDDSVSEVLLIIDDILQEYNLSSPLDPGEAVFVPLNQSLAIDENHVFEIVNIGGVSYVQTITQCTYEQGCSGYIFTIGEIIVT